MLCSVVSRAQQDSLSTTTLDEVVITGTRFDVTVDRSGKTIYKLDASQLNKNAGKSVADLLNEVPGIQVDGNFSSPGANLSYYVRGGRNKHTLILIDGIPVNDPSSISAEYDLRYIPLSQIESVEVLKGGLSTLYGTGAAAGVINIRLREPGPEKLKGQIDVSGGSYRTFSQNGFVAGNGDRFTWLASVNNFSSQGFSSALDQDPAKVFDKDGINKQNVLVRAGMHPDARFNIDLYTAVERFDADYDAYEFTDAPNRQFFRQVRVGINPTWTHARGTLEGRISYQLNNREFRSDFPEDLTGKTFQAELIDRRRISDHIQTFSGINIQRMAYVDEMTGDDPSNFIMVDPYSSVFLDYPSGLNVHAGLRLNTHNVYGSQLIYNLNPSFTFNRKGAWQYKVLASVSTSYITPSLYQFYSLFGNTELKPERSLNWEAGLSVYHKIVTANAVLFARRETDPIDFVTIVDEMGNYVGGQYQNITDTRLVDGIEFDVAVQPRESWSLTANLAYMDTDKRESFYKIPRVKYGAALSWKPLSPATISLKYNFTGDRTIFDFFSFSEMTLGSYALVDLYLSWRLKGKITFYAGVNNLLDEDFIGLYGYTTRSRNYNAGMRFDFAK